MKNQFYLDGININCNSIEATAASIACDCSSDCSFAVFTINLDHIVKLRRSAEFRAAYSRARYVTADGFPIVWASRLSGARIDQVAGADLIKPLCAEAARAGHPVFLFGSQFKSLSGAARRLCASYPELEIAGVCAPERDFNPTSDQAVACAQEIARSGAKICFVALGAPKQELFSSLAIEKTSGVAFVCIGAGLDFLSGNQARAPRWVRRVRAEWLWRLLSDPKRLSRRYFDCALLLPSVLLARLVR